MSREQNLHQGYFPPMTVYELVGVDDYESNGKVYKNMTYVKPTYRQSGLKNYNDPTLQAIQAVKDGDVEKFQEFL